MQVKVIQDGVAYTTVEDCYANDHADPHGIHIPVGTVLRVSSTDWSSKNWPCYEASYEGKPVFLTPRLVETVR